MPTQTSTFTTQHSMTSFEVIDREAHSIWHITELLSKLGNSSSPNQPDLCCDGEVTLTTATIQHVAKQISNHVSNIVESVESLDVK